jgi:hypothetical protein
MKYRWWYGEGGDSNGKGYRADPKRQIPNRGHRDRKQIGDLQNGDVVTGGYQNGNIQNRNIQNRLFGNRKDCNGNRDWKFQKGYGDQRGNGRRGGNLKSLGARPYLVKESL